jgi:hypothetical protein
MNGETVDLVMLNYCSRVSLAARAAAIYCSCIVFLLQVRLLLCASKSLETGTLFNQRAIAACQ